jgi:expansin (peptidoglycan-binding protein)
MRQYHLLLISVIGVFPEILGCSDSDSISDAETDAPADSNDRFDSTSDSGSQKNDEKDVYQNLDDDSRDSTEIDTDTEADAGTGTDSDKGADTESEFDTTACDYRTPVYPEVLESGGTGNVTTYGSVTDPVPSQGGACNYGKTGVLGYAAINVNVSPGDGKGQWNGGRICGQCAEVWAETPTGLKSTVVRIMDKCPDEYCGIDLGGLPAQILMGTQAGRYDGGWQFISCERQQYVSDGPTALFVKEGSNQWWALVQVRNPPAPVLSIDWKSDKGYGTFEYATEAENYYRVPKEILEDSGKVMLTIKYAYNLSNTVEISGTDLIWENSLIPL